MIHLTFRFSAYWHFSLRVQVMKTYHMYHSESISAESKLKEAEKQEEKQIGRGDQVFSIRMEDKYQRRSSVKKIEKMKEKVYCASAFGTFNYFHWYIILHKCKMLSAFNHLSPLAQMI